jgi:hypothetical protein
MVQAAILKEAPLAQELIEVLGQGKELIKSLTDDEYRRCKANESSIGAHFRHIVEFVNQLLSGIESGRIDYSLRQRDPRIETDRRYAAETFRQSSAGLAELRADVFGENIVVKPEFLSDSAQLNIWCRSSVLRELDFVHSHTIHHYALIAEKLVAMKLRVPDNFGISPSTIRYREGTSR